ncbi:MAG TPA: hypothetical protein VG253_20970 [Streptosporangiaceae bacterium]|nr:hypothetical protein [Streptosporangiaceae bacterium]
MSAHLFADESKARGLVLVAAAVMPRDLAPMRALVDSLRLPRQRRLHFSSERDDRRKQIINRFTAAGVGAVVYDASGWRDAKAARDAAVARLADDAAKMGASLVILERDDSAVEADRRIIRERLLHAGCHDRVSYDHRRAHEECLLAIPDAIAWCWAKGGRWRERSERLLREVVKL